MRRVVARHANSNRRPRKICASGTTRTEQNAMGLKRKASFSLSPTSTVTTLSLSPGNTPQPLPFHHFHSQYSRDWASPEPYFAHGMLSDSTPLHLNSRTRKRFRDGRPDKETIHQNTLSMLFAAQKHQQHQQSSHAYGYGPERDPHRDGLLTPSPSPAPPRRQLNIDNDNASATAPPSQKEKAQQTLSCFFHISSPSAIQKPAYGSHKRSDAVQQFSYPLASPALQTPSVKPQNHDEMQVFDCEDCNNPLFQATTTTTTTSGEGDMAMTDVDQIPAAPVPDCTLEDWACARCSKHVCDLCAVRRDERLCLECANPGGGGRSIERNLEHRERRWIGGVGWM